MEYSKLPFAWSVLPGCLQSYAQRPLAAGSGATILHSPRCFLNRWYFMYPLPLLRAFLIGIVPPALVLWKVNSSFLGSKKSYFLKRLKTVHSPHRSPCQTPSIDQLLLLVYSRGPFTVGFPTGVMTGLCGGEGIIQERWCCARGWLMMAVITADICTLLLFLYTYLT